MIDIPDGELRRAVQGAVDSFVNRACVPGDCVGVSLCGDGFDCVRALSPLSSVEESVEWGGARGTGALALTAGHVLESAVHEAAEVPPQPNDHILALFISTLTRWNDTPLDWELTKAAVLAVAPSVRVHIVLVNDWAGDRPAPDLSAFTSLWSHPHMATVTRDAGARAVGDSVKAVAKTILAVKQGSIRVRVHTQCL